MGEMRIPDRDEGDLKTIWDKDKPEEVKAAKKQYDDLLKKGYFGYTVDKNGKKGRKINEFDPDAEMIIMSTPLVGG